MDFKQAALLILAGSALIGGTAVRAQALRFVGSDDSDRARAADSVQESSRQDTDPATSRPNVREQGEKAHVDALVAAGFSPDRIAWLRQRTAELQQQLKQDLEQRRQQGQDVDPMVAAYAFDDDLQLMDDIGLAEYERYRQALGRPMGVAVLEVDEDSIAATAGLRPGDEIVRYDGQRVFNFVQLNVAARRQAAGNARLDFRRDGRESVVTVPRGPLGFTPAPIAPFIFGVDVGAQPFRPAPAPR